MLAILGVLGHGLVGAAGIPVVDVQGIAKMVENAVTQARQALDQLNCTKAMISNAQSVFNHIKSVTEGNWNLGSVLNDPTLTSYLPSKTWSDVYSMNSGDLAALRQQYGLKSDNPVLQQRFDNLLSNLNMMQKSYAASAQRQQNIQQLANYLNSAQTPAQKQDLMNRIQYEQVQLQNEKARLDSVQKLMDMQQRAQADKAANDFVTTLRKIN
jgi:type IV secretion system protein VirB5